MVPAGRRPRRGVLNRKQLKSRMRTPANHGKSNDPNILSTFIPLTDKDRKLLKIFTNTLSKNRIDFKFSEANANKMIGWVKISY